MVQNKPTTPRFVFLGISGRPSGTRKFVHARLGGGDLVFGAGVS